MAKTLLDLSQWLSNLPGQLVAEEGELRQAAENQVRRIKGRTAQGIAVDGTQFEEYAKTTKKTSPVTLRDSGAMLDNITVSASNDEARIYFSDSDQEQKAIFTQTGTKDSPARPFMGASITDREEIVSDVRQALFKRLNS